MRHTLEETLHNTGIMVIDGAMSTALEALGCNLADSLWSAKILAEAPEKIKQVHSDYFKAGADCESRPAIRPPFRDLWPKGQPERKRKDSYAGQ